MSIWSRFLCWLFDHHWEETPEVHGEYAPGKWGAGMWCARCYATGINTPAGVLLQG